MLTRLVGVAFAVVSATLVPAPLGLEPAPPRGSVRLLVKKSDDVPTAPRAPLLATLVNIHSGESTPLTADAPSPAALSALLQDRALQEQVTFDPRLLERIRALAAGLPSEQAPPRIEIVSGYRSAKLNERLRKKGRHVASHSQHSLGHAIDFRLGNAAPRDVEKALLAAGWDGGIGRYDGATDRFVHLDVGKKRRWIGR